MFSAGVGAISEENLYKKDAKQNVNNGGSRVENWIEDVASSLDQDSNNSDNDQSAVQRGDPEMCAKMNNVIRYLR